MQKIIFYQEEKPKAADALWLHHGYDSNGNKKESISIDYIQNGVVRHIMDAGSGGDVAQIIASEENNFDSTKSYSKGDVIIKDGVLYVFISDHAAGEWDATEVSETDILSILSEMQQSGATPSGQSAVYKPLLNISPVGADMWPHMDVDGSYVSCYGVQLTAQAAAALLGMTEDDFSSIFTVGAPTYLKPSGSSGNNNYYILTELAYDYEEHDAVVADVMLMYDKNGDSIQLLCADEPKYGRLYTIYWNFFSTPK